MAKTKRKFEVGDTVIVLSDHLPEPAPGEIIAITSQAGKTIGVNLVKPVGVHTCDGLCGKGHGLWVTPTEITTPEQFEAEKKALAELKQADPSHFNEIEVTTDGQGRTEVDFVTTE